jgi:hypothetical protein
MLIKIFKQVVLTICLVSILFSSPALALASQNTEAHIPKGDLDIANKFIMVVILAPLLVFIISLRILTFLEYK